MEKGAGGCCELCGKTARMYCESDEARLCWDCDEKVHSANFLVAKHSRSLLCHVCQSPTPWKASGTKLGPTISVCKTCCCLEDTCFRTAEFHPAGAGRTSTRLSTRMTGQAEDDQATTDSDLAAENSDDVDDDDDEYSDDSDDTDDEMEEEEDGENQVVPWSSSSPPAPSNSSASPSSSATSSSSSELGLGSFSARDGGAVVSSSLKLSHHNPSPDSDEDEDVCCSSEMKLNAGALMEDRRRVARFRSLRAEEADDHWVHRQPESEIELMRIKKRRMDMLKGSFLSFQQMSAGGRDDKNASEVVRRISQLSKNAL